MTIIPDHLRRALSFFALPALKAQAQIAIAYERDLLELHALIGPPLTVDELKEIVAKVAWQSTHPNSEVPAHLAALLKNKWYAEAMPEPRGLVDALPRVFVTDCNERCLAKFLELRGKAVKAKEQAGERD